MSFPRFTIRRLMLAVAIVALIMAASMAVWKLLHDLRDGISAGLTRAYGKGGILDLEGQISTHLRDGKDALQQDHFAEAEGHYKSVLHLNEVLLSKLQHVGWSQNLVPEAELGVADALAGQGRVEEAERFYRQCLAGVETRLGKPHYVDAEHLERYAVFLRKIGRRSEAKELEARAIRILDEFLAAYPSDARNELRNELELRTQRIRTRLAE